MRSLFLKIFLWFWATATLTGLALVLTFILQPRTVPSPWRAMLESIARESGAIAAGQMDRGGVSAATVYIEGLDRRTGLRACLYSRVGEALAGSNCRTFAAVVSQAAKSGETAFGMSFGIARVALPIRIPNRGGYIFATELPSGPRAGAGHGRRSIVLAWGIAFLVSGLVCYLLTRYLTSPIFRLRKAAQELSQGHLSTRAARAMKLRHDELGDLVRDFDAMAGQVENLVVGQRRLISDISHEVRSPLARLNLALDLAAQRKGPDPAFDHMRKDLAMLNGITGQLLTMASLEAPRLPSMRMINLAEVVARIVHDAEFELQARGGSVSLQAPQQCFVNGNSGLLHSAVENVVSNAIHYGDLRMPIEVKLESACEGQMVRLTVRDHGLGVPEEELANIFRPFFRVGEDRDRRSGGTGLGLAIAERIVRAHGGTIRAANVAPVGFRVEILLPAKRPSSVEGRRRTGSS